MTAVIGMSSPPEFMPGDVVQLKSNSAKMVVLDITMDDYRGGVASCGWMNYNINDYKTAAIPFVALRRAK